MIYIVMKEDMDDNSVVSVHKTLDSANIHAKRQILDNWRVQDGYPYRREISEDGRKTYILQNYIAYYVDKYELQE